MFGPCFLVYFYFFGQGKLWSQLITKSTVVGIEPNWASKKDRQCAWVQVEVNVREGLVGSVKIVYGENFWIQKVDYWKLPFRCFESHHIRHVRA